MKKVILSIVSIFLFTIIPVGAVWAVTIKSYSDMPMDIMTLYPDFKSWDDPTHFSNVLQDYNINTQIWSNPDSKWISSSGFASGLSNFYSSNLSSSVAPYNSTMYQIGTMFVFENPVFSLGGTFFATNNPPIDVIPGSFDNNVQNNSYEVVAYDINGNVIEKISSSSYDNIVGPVEFHNTTTKSIEFMTSYAGIWSDIPIYSATFLGIRPIDGAILASYGSFSFSRSRYQAPIPEPATMLLFGVGLLGIAGISRKRKAI